MTDEGTYVKGIEYYLSSVKTAVDAAKESLEDAKGALSNTTNTEAYRNLALERIKEAMQSLDEIH